MLGSITPLGERGRAQRYGITVGSLIVGSTAAGVGVGGALGAAGGPAIGLAPPWTRMALLAGVVIAGALFDARVGGLRLPTVRRQVDETWLNRYRGWVYGAGFGLQLGTGVATIVTTAAVYAALAAEFLSGSWAAGAMIGGTFGVVRAATVLPGARVRSMDRLVRVDAALRRWERSSRRATVAVQAALAATALAFVLA